MTYSSYVKYIEEVMPPESPSLLGLHPNAEIGYLTASAENLLANITALDNGDANGNDEKGYGDSVRSIMSSLLEKLPKRFDMITLSAKAAQMLSGPSGPYIVVALQECSRMNLLLNEIERSLMELEKGLKGQLNISQEMEDLAQAIRINQWPGRNVFSKCSWERLAWPSQKSLLSQFSDMLLRIEQLVQWTENLIEPKSIWLPGLFNPSSYLTATQQVCARKSGLALDKMTMETHVTTFWDHSEITDYAHDGTYIHGLYIEGARWPKGDDAGEISLIEGTKCAGFLFDSKPKELTPLMPVRSVHFIFVADCCRHDFETLQTQIGYLCPSRSCTR
jgi:dynein heavy chain